MLFQQANNRTYFSLSCFLEICFALQEFRRSQEPVDRSDYTISFYNLLKEYKSNVNFTPAFNLTTVDIRESEIK